MIANLNAFYYIKQGLFCVLYINIYYLPNIEKAAVDKRYLMCCRSFVEDIVEFDTICDLDLDFNTDVMDETEFSELKTEKIKL